MSGLVAIAVVGAGWWALTQFGEDGGRRSASAPPSDAASGELSVLNTADFHSLAISPVERDVVLYGHHGGVLRSDDGGRTWRKTNLAGETDDAMGMGFAGANGEAVYAAGHGTFFGSTDGGQTWERIRPNLPATDVHGMASAPDDAGRLYVNVVRFGVYRSDDGGESWVAAGSGPFPGDIIQLAASRSNRLYLASVDAGVMRSNDGGNSLSRTARIDSQVLAVAASATDPDAVYAGTAHGLFASTDGGDSWTKREVPGGGQILAVAVNPQEPFDLVLVAVQADGAGHVFRSRDGGLTWGG